ncbi:glycosyltransferase 87 family protein [Plantactinospora sp. WMMB334]|uniref:glycosyltransferase 87 family protein n=1 Tax=Plantactinospora sp. WMMB334 TaxID=3404119 RepID=UPI003B9340F3
MTGPPRPYARMFLLLGLAGAIAVAIALLPGHRGWFDIGVYHGAVNHWVHDGGRLYDYVRPGTGYGFTYPPFAALCMLPLAVLDWHPAIAVNAAVTGAAAAFVLWLLVDPIARREGWHRGFGFAFAVCLFAMLGPVRDTVSFGQVNLVLLALVYADLWLLERGHRLAGVGSGVAAAVKLTPAIFIGYLVVTRRWRAAGTAAATAAVATLLAWLVAPEATRTYFGRAVWDTGRVGSLEYVSNQSLLGLAARWNPEHPNRLAWLVLVAVVLVVWAHRTRQAVRRGDERAGFALTGIVACLVSPVTWVHHLVWLVPALVVLADSTLARRAERAECPEDPRPPWRWLRLRLWLWQWRAPAAAYLLLCGSVVWLWSGDHGGVGFSAVVGFLGSNSYVLLSLAMLLFLPLTTSGGTAPAGREPERPRSARTPR